MTILLYVFPQARPSARTACPQRHARILALRSVLAGRRDQRPRQGRPVLVGRPRPLLRRSGSVAPSAPTRAFHERKIAEGVRPPEETVLERAPAPQPLRYSAPPPIAHNRHRRR